MISSNTSNELRRLGLGISVHFVGISIELVTLYSKLYITNETLHTHGAVWFIVGVTGCILFIVLPDLLKDN